MRCSDAIRNAVASAKDKACSNGASVALEINGEDGQKSPVEIFIVVRFIPRKTPQRVQV
jgi:hypothetical protein